MCVWVCLLLGALEKQKGGNAATCLLRFHANVPKPAATRGTTNPCAGSACGWSRGFSPVFAVLPPVTTPENKKDKESHMRRRWGGKFTFTKCECSSQTHGVCPGVPDGSAHLHPLYWIFIIESYGCSVPLWLTVLSELWTRCLTDNVELLSFRGARRCSFLSLFQSSCIHQCFFKGHE